MLLHPKNENIKFNIDDIDKTNYFKCSSLECSVNESGGLLSIFRKYLMNGEILPMNISNSEVFVPDIFNFIIFDDLRVIPDNVHRCVTQPKKFGIENLNAIKVVTVNLTLKEIVDLLNFSLISNTPLTDFFLKREGFYENLVKGRKKIVFDNVKPKFSDEVGFIKLKVVGRKSQNKIFFVQAGDDFINILLSFLTYPLGGVVNMLEGNSSLGSIHNLYKSVLVLDPIKHLKSHNLMGKFVKSDSDAGFVKKPSLYIVTNDLVVTSGSYISVISYLNKFGVSSSDLDEQIITIGKKECFSLLKASLISSSVLTDVLGKLYFPLRRKFLSKIRIFFLFMVLMCFVSSVSHRTSYF
ncbi:hypothetical protein Lalb_Chr03g0042901 [Lupinus albus]|uniref:DUF674 family protein n=1 Tax=Lupinus albus TaxID=3870 RepID=A0A6A4QX37_LUPAL|nr:hypothetical protein Lalb_Chr03g0042901 [Lupinus albus]